MKDIDRRIARKSELLRGLPQEMSEEYLRVAEEHVGGGERKLRFQLTILCGFIENLLRVRAPSHDDRQEKRLRHMGLNGVRAANTLCLLNSSILRRPDSAEAEEKLKRAWLTHIERSAKIGGCDLTLTLGLSYLHFPDSHSLQQFLFLKFVEDNRRGPPVEERERGGNYLSLPEVLKCLGEMDHMGQGRPVTFTREQTVTMDYYSLNRVVNVNEDEPGKFLVASCLAKQGSRLSARYASLLPACVPHLEVLAHLLFYPFLALATNPHRTRYEHLQLRRRYRLPLPFLLTAAQVQQANHLRGMVRSYLSLDSDPSLYAHFPLHLLKFLFQPRQDIVDEERWEQAFLGELFAQHPELREAYLEAVRQAEEEKAERGERPFMEALRCVRLKPSFLGEGELAGRSAGWRREQYVRWKREKLAEVRAIEEKAVDHFSYLCCGECGVRLAKMTKVCGVTREIYRDLLEVEAGNVRQAPFNEMDSHFCTLLLGNYCDFSYTTWACANAHYFAIKIHGESRLKILPFSPLLIAYPDGSTERAEFEKLDLRHWKRRHEERLRNKMSMRISTLCYLCDQTFDCFSELEAHMKHIDHQRTRLQFEKTLRTEDPRPKQLDDDGY